MACGNETPPVPGARGCGCQAAIAFLVIVGLPVLLIYSFGNAPCRDGPCDPGGARRLGDVALIVAGLAIAVGLATWQIVAWWSRRQAARGRDGRRRLELAGAALALLAVAALLLLVLS